MKQRLLCVKKYRLFLPPSPGPEEHRLLSAVRRATVGADCRRNADDVRAPARRARASTASRRRRADDATAAEGL